MRAAPLFWSLLSDPAQLDLALAKLRGQVGAMILRKWEFPDDIVTTAIEVEDWNREPRTTADCCDVVMVAQLLSYVGTPKAKEVAPLGEGVGYSSGWLRWVWSRRRAASIIAEARETIRGLRKALAG